MFEMNKVLILCLPFFIVVASRNITENKSIDEQVKNIDPKIIGGSAADLGDFPYQCLLQIETSQAIISCGCSIIAENWVVTATFCTNNISPSSMIVGVGFVSVKELNDGLNGQLLKVVKKVEYPGYSESSLKNEISLLKLETDLEFDENVDKINIPTSDLSVGSTASISGYGYLYEGIRPSTKILRSANVDVFSNNQCEGWFRKLNPSFRMLSKTFCAGKITGSADICNGDGGGPLARVVNGKPYLYGISLGGFDCGRPESPGIFTQVNEYADWINGNIDDEKECSISSECAEDAYCINYTCVCNAGYEGDGIIKCNKNGGALNSRSKAVIFASFMFYCFSKLI